MNKVSLAERRFLESKLGPNITADIMKQRGYEKTPEEKRDAKIKRIIDEETKKPVNENYTDKLKRLKQRQRLEFATNWYTVKKDKSKTAKAFEQMKARAKDLNAKEEALKKLQDKHKLNKAFEQMKAKATQENLTSNKSMSSHDLAKDAKAYRDKHMDELRMIQSNIDLDDGRRFEVLKDHLEPVIQIVLKFIKNKGYSIDDSKDIIQAIGFEIPKPYMRIMKTIINERLNNKQTKKEEVKQYPPRYTTSQPKPEKPITSTYKPKLNLSHIQQINKPASVSPSENTRNRAIGQVEGLEEDRRLYNSEKDLYIKALKNIDDVNLLTSHKIHSTNNVKAAVSALPNGKQFRKRLTSWR